MGWNVSRGVSAIFFFFHQKRNLHFGFPPITKIKHWNLLFSCQETVLDVSAIIFICNNHCDHYPRSSELIFKPVLGSGDQRFPSESSFWEAATGRANEDPLPEPRRTRRFLGQRGTMDSPCKYSTGMSIWPCSWNAPRQTAAFISLQRPQTVRGSWVKHTGLDKQSVSAFNLFRSHLASNTSIKCRYSSSEMAVSHVLSQTVNDVCIICIFQCTCYEASFQTKCL